jgi:hypothetical protein
MRPGKPLLSPDKGRKMKPAIRLAATCLALSGCTRGGPPAAPTTPTFPASFTGVWAGDAGPNLAALKFGAKIEIQEDGGGISGEFFNEDPERPGVYLPTGQIQGTRDGGTLFLTTGTAVDMGDAGTLGPQLLILSYDGKRLVGLRRLQLPGRPVVNEYLVLQR